MWVCQGGVLWVTAITMKPLSILTVVVLWSVGGRRVSVRIIWHGISLVVTIIAAITIIKTCFISKWYEVLTRHALVVVPQPCRGALELLISFVFRYKGRVGDTFGSRWPCTLYSC